MTPGLEGRVAKLEAAVAPAEDAPLLVVVIGHPTEEEIQSAIEKVRNTPLRIAVVVGEREAH